MSSKKDEQKENPKAETFTLKGKCKIGEKEYQKGDTIEVKSEKGRDFLRVKRLID